MAARTRGAGGEVALAGAAEEAQRTPSINDAEQPRKQVALGFCVCGADIDSNLHTLGCRTCSAWARWRSAFRVAMSAIRGPQ